MPKTQPKLGTLSLSTLTFLRGMVANINVQAGSADAVQAMREAAVILHELDGAIALIAPTQTQQVAATRRTNAAAARKPAARKTPAKR